MTEPGSSVPSRRGWRANEIVRAVGAQVPWKPLLTAATSVLLGGCSMIEHRQSYMLTAGPVAARQQEIFMTTVYVTVAIFVVVTGALLYAVFKYRDDNSTELPPQIHGNPLIEGSLGVVSALLLVLIAVPTVSGIFYMAEVPGLPAASGSPAAEVSTAASPEVASASTTPDAAASGSPDAASTASPTPEPVVIPPGPINLTVTGHQWWWEFEYSDLGVTTSDELHIPVGRPINITLHSADVIHSFWVPRLAGKTDVIPGQENHMWFQGDVVSKDPYYGQCTEFCGASHAMMVFKVYVDTPEDYIAWLQHQKLEATPAPDSDASLKAGQTVVENVCAACHTVRGTQAGGSLGPDLTHLKSREYIISDWFPNNDTNLRKWLENPQAVKPEALMKLPRKLSEEEITNTIKFLDTLK